MFKVLTVFDFVLFRWQAGESESSVSFQLCQNKISSEEAISYGTPVLCSYSFSYSNIILFLSLPRYTSSTFPTAFNNVYSLGYCILSTLFSQLLHCHLIILSYSSYSHPLSLLPPSAIILSLSFICSLVLKYKLIDIFYCILIIPVLCFPVINYCLFFFPHCGLL